MIRLASFLARAATLIVDRHDASAPGHRARTFPATPPAFTQTVHVNVTPRSATAPGTGGAMAAGPVHPPLRDHVQQLLDERSPSCWTTKGIPAGTWTLRTESADAPSMLPWPCRHYGHEPMASNPQRCYSGCDLSDTTAQG